MKIPITKPYFNQAEEHCILRPLRSGWIVQGPEVEQFEKLFSVFTGSSFAIAVSNCTNALHLGLEALHIGVGDRVVVPSFTYVASQNSIETAGAEVVFADIDLDTFNLSTSCLIRILEQDRERKIKAIMPVNLFGLAADLEEIVNISRSYGIKIIEDSACGFNARIKGKHSGTFGNLGCFSFHPRKAITTGEGGMIITDNQEIFSTACRLRDHGAESSDLSRHEKRGGSLLPEFNFKGYNYRMTDIQAALGVCQMAKADKIISKRDEIAARYQAHLKEIKSLRTPLVPKEYTHGYQSYVCLYTGGEGLDNLSMEQIDRLNLKRNRLIFDLEENGIATRQGTHAVHTLGYYRQKYGFDADAFLNSYAADRLTIALPLYPSMSQIEFDYVISHLKQLTDK